jgi:hypothetical protein
MKNTFEINLRDTLSTLKHVSFPARYSPAISALEYLRGIPSKSF